MHYSNATHYDFILIDFLHFPSNFTRQYANYLFAIPNKRSTSPGHHQYPNGAPVFRVDGISRNNQLSCFHLMSSSCFANSKGDTKDCIGTKFSQNTENKIMIKRKHTFLIKSVIVNVFITMSFIMNNLLLSSSSLFISLNYFQIVLFLN